MHHLSLVDGTRVTVVNPEGQAISVSIETLADGFQYFTPYGDVRFAEVRRSPKREKLRIIGARSGEPIRVGETHTIYARDTDMPFYRRRPVTELSQSSFVRLPQKKAKPWPGMFDALDLDGKDFVLKVEQVADLLPMMQAAAFCGLTVQRHKTKLQITIDQNRPACFPSKLINGNFQQDFRGTAEGLAAGGIIWPWTMDWMSWISRCERAGTFFEGNSMFNDTLLLPSGELRFDSFVWHVTLMEPECPVETTWFCT